MLRFILNPLRACRSFVSIRVSLMLSVVVGAGSLSGSPASAAVLTWNNAGGGSAFSPGNWSPPQMPTGADLLVFNIAGSYPVTFGGGSSSQLLFGAGTVTVTAPHSSGSIIVASNTTNPQLILTDGTLTAGATVIGDGTATSSGIVHVNDDDALLNSGNMLVVGDEGTGSMQLSAGGRALCATLLVANTSSEFGTVTIGSLDAAVVSELDALATAVVGDDGTGTINIQSRGRVDVGAHMIIGGNSTSIGTVGMTSGAIPTAELNVGGDLHIGHSSTGGMAGDGNLILTGNSIANIAGTTFIGNAGGGALGLDELRVQDNAHFTTGSLNATSPFSHTFSGGTVTIDGGTVEWPTTQSFTVGGGTSPALVELINGAQATLGVPGAGSLLLGVTGGGQGTFAVRLGSTCDIPQGLVRINHGSLIVEVGCTFDLAEALIAEADPSLISVNGLLNAGQTTIANGNSMTVNGVNADAFLTGQCNIGGSPTVPDTGGDLTIANSGVVNCAGVMNVHAGGELAVSAGGLCDIASPNVLTLRGGISLSGGTVEVDQLIAVAGSTISGNGTIRGNQLTNGGSISGAATLNFDCLVTGPSPATVQTINGSIIQFLSNGGFTGQGAINSSVVCVTGSVITATGPLAMGDSGLFSSVALSGELHAGPHAVILNDTNNMDLGPLTTIDGGSLTLSSGNMSITGTDVLRTTGDSDIQAATLINANLVDLSTPDAALHVTGNYTHTGTGGPGDLRVTINNLDAGQLTVSGSATLSGTLTIDRSGTTPAIGQQFTIISAGSISGAFSSVFVVDFPSCVGVQLTYNSSSVTATIVGDTCPADIAPGAGDGLVNVSDLLAVIGGWGACANPNLCPADIAPIAACGNDVVNVEDLLAVIGAWGGVPVS